MDLEIRTGCPLVSVCIPVFNGGQTLRRTLDSIYGQDYPNIEVLVSDNGSTDGTSLIAREFEERKGLRYVLNSKCPEWGENLPGYLIAESNWNYALSLASGDFIALYHADDLYAPCMVSKQVEFLRSHPELSSVFTMSQTIDENDRPIYPGILRLPKDLQGRECFDFETLFNAVLTHTNFVKTPTMMTRRATLQAVGMFDASRFRTSSDLDLWLRMAQWHPIGIIDEPLHYYRISPNQGWRRINERRTELQDFFGVMDYWLSDAVVGQKVSIRARDFYETERAADQILCAINLAAQGKTAEAKERLRLAIINRTMRMAWKKPRWLARVLVGMILLGSITLGSGLLVAKVIERLFAWYLKKRFRAMASEVVPYSPFASRAGL